VPKGVMLTHTNIVRSTVNMTEFMQGTSSDVFLIAAPIYHIFGMLVNLFCAILSEAKFVLMDVYKPDEALALIEQEKVTVHHGVATMYILELNHPDLEKYDLSSLRIGITGGAPCSPETAMAVIEKMNMEFCIGYGISEANSLTNTPVGNRDPEVFKTLGTPLKGVEIKIVDDQRNELPADTVGEIAIRSHGVMKGYLNNPEETRKVLDDEGWFYTGDLGKLDTKGYLHFVGRKKEMILRGGFNVYPIEVEGCLLKNPHVVNAAVFGIPDPVHGEQVCAAVKLKEDSSVTEDELKAYLKTYLAPYKVPSKYIFVDDFPMTPSGKIQKTKLQEQVIAEMEKEKTGG
jgi:fatty-acyl-CoA synthase/long-chain acyl-CoA synthetase